MARLGLKISIRHSRLHNECAHRHSMNTAGRLLGKKWLGEQRCQRGIPSCSPGTQVPRGPPTVQLRSPVISRHWLRITIVLSSPPLSLRCGALRASQTILGLAKFKRTHLVASRCRSHADQTRHTLRAKRDVRTCILSDCTWGSLFLSLSLRRRLSFSLAPSLSSSFSCSSLSRSLPLPAFRPYLSPLSSR